MEEIQQRFGHVDLNLDLKTYHEGRWRDDIPDKVVINIVVDAKPTVIPIEGLFSSVGKVGSFYVIRYYNHEVIHINNLSLRRIAYDDHKFLDELYNYPEIYTQIANSKPPSEDYGKKLAISAEEDFLLFNGFLGYIIVHEGKYLVGHVMMSPKTWRNWSKHTFSSFGSPIYSILRIAILPAFQGQGIATTIIPCFMKIYNMIYPSLPIFISAFSDGAWGKFLASERLPNTKLVHNNDLVLVKFDKMIKSPANCVFAPPNDLSTRMMKATNVSDQLPLLKGGDVQFLMVVGKFVFYEVFPTDKIEAAAFYRLVSRLRLKGSGLIYALVTLNVRNKTFGRLMETSEGYDYLNDYAQRMFAICG